MPNEETICHHCNKPITGKGIIRQGKPYHDHCWDELREEAAYDAVMVLRKEFSGINNEDLDDLYDSCKDPDELTGTLKSSWCVITRTSGNIETTAFDTKKEMLEWITECIWETMPEDYAWDILYVLREGKTKDFDLKAVVK